MRPVFGGVLLYFRQITCIDHLSEFREICCGHQRFIMLPDFIEPIIGVDDQAVDQVSNYLRHFVLPAAAATPCG
jgi:hypothetical protein